MKEGFKCIMCVRLMKSISVSAWLVFSGIPIQPAHPPIQLQIVLFFERLFCPHQGMIDACQRVIARQLRNLGIQPTSILALDWSLYVCETGVRTVGYSIVLSCS